MATYTDPTVQRRTEETRSHSDRSATGYQDKVTGTSATVALIAGLLVGGLSGFLVGRNNPSEKFRAGSTSPTSIASEASPAPQTLSNSGSMTQPNTGNVSGTQSTVNGQVSAGNSTATNPPTGAPAQGAIGNTR